MLAILLVAQLVAGNTDRVETPDGRTKAYIKEDPPGRYNVYTPRGDRLGYGRESSYGTGDIEFFKSNGDRWFTVKPQSPPSDSRGSGGGGRRGR